MIWMNGKWHKLGSRTCQICAVISSSDIQFLGETGLEPELDNWYIPFVYFVNTYPTHY